MEQNPKERLARSLFFETGKTQKEIAGIIGVSEKTIYLWMKQGDWKRLRSNSRLMPSLIAENFLSQVQELNEDIRQRGQGKRYPTVQEAEIFRKMVMTIGRIQKGHTQGQYSEMMKKFLSFILPQNLELVKTLTYYADDFLKSRNPEGFAPFDIEYEPPTPKQDPHILRLHKVTRFLSASEINSLASLREASPASEPSATKQSHDNTDTPANDTSLSFGEGRGEAQTPGTDPQADKPVTTRNCTETSYGITVKAFSDTPPQKPEIKNEPETGNSSPSPSMKTENTSPSPSMEKGPGDEVPAEHIPGITYRLPDGTLKLIPPYKSKEYYEIPLYLRERLYTMAGEPIKDRKVSRYF
ncbi:MAG: hypothetical protein BGO69_13840 [Bacteroidetes bacterium 46-16]|nr:MAG: hypothetical protein BGO69_13840 [Bacteroidetes bacterium 46-16]